MSKFLEEKTLILKPNPRKGGMIKDKGHIGFFRYNGTFESFMLPRDSHNGGLVELFKSTAEREFFANELGRNAVELNVRSKDNYFYNYQVKILKDDSFMTRGVSFDLSNPVDNLKYKILVKSGRVAPSYDDRYQSGAYSYYFVEKDFEHKNDLSRINQESEIWGLYNDMKDSSEKMYEFLFLYWLKTKKSTMPPNNPTLDYCKGQISQIISADKKGFLGVFNSPSIKDEMMVYKGLNAGFIDYDGTKYLNLEKIEIGRKLEDVIRYFNDPLNSADKLKLRASLTEASKKNKDNK